MVAPPNAVSVGTLLSVIKYQETFEQEDVSGDTKESDVIQHVRLVDMVKNARTTAVGIVGTKNPVDLQRSAINITLGITVTARVIVKNVRTWTDIVVFILATLVGLVTHARNRWRVQTVR
ncbi:hypothetical protein MAR_022936 [Mya arenaria]|uniref:Uncharacterized protein n=1 Tax=Mya arenaria TaxID=6604 RepID=A0ABY7DR27_MYAAR|nr:hypothetical protein MAR_022936 [Mya arenaria]